jgi:hypothetical protein
MRLLQEQRRLLLVRVSCHNCYKVHFAFVVMSFPSVSLTREAYLNLPHADEQPDHFWNYCPLDFMYRYTETDTKRECIGHVVPGEEALCAQLGAALLSLPERFINRYVPSFTQMP